LNNERKYHLFEYINTFWERSSTCSNYNVYINYIKICLKRDNSSGHTIEYVY
jgi:hypothetical protein